MRNSNGRIRLLKVPKDSPFDILKKLAPFASSFGQSNKGIVAFENPKDHLEWLMGELYLPFEGRLLCPRYPQLPE